MAGWHISSIAVKAFKSFPSWTTFEVPPNAAGGTAQLVGIVGGNGQGKSVLLEAICFACGGSPSMLRLPGGSLRGVTSTDAGTQLPEVRLTLRREAEQHVLEARLTPEGARAYRVDGRARTGTQVKELLKGCGMTIDETTFIQQASVTRLSDNNSAAALAHLVGSASGSNTWNAETAAARAEVARTQTALRSIEDNIARVQASTAADDAAMRKAAEAAQLEQELEAQLQQLLQGLQAQRRQLEQQVEASHAKERELQDSDAAAGGRLQQLLAAQERLATQQAQVLAEVEAHGADSTASGSRSSSLLQRIAAAEAQAAALEAAAASRAALRAELQAVQQQVQEQEAGVQRLQHSLSCKQQEAAQLAGNLAAGRATTDAAASVKQQLQEAGRQAAIAAAAVSQQQAEVATRQAAVQQLKSTLLEMQAASPASTPDSQQGWTLASAAATAHQHLASLQQQLLRLQMDAEAATRPLTSPSTASLLTSLGPAAEARPLHQCFRIKSATAAAAASAGPPAAAAGNLGAASLEQLLTPLSVIAGPSVLQTLVVPSVAHANRLLAAAAAGGGGGGGHGRNKLKIWPLDRLSAANVQHRQRAAQQQLGRQAVLLPLDLLEYDAACESALLRAFGGLVVAANDATAAALVEQYGLSAVTLQGTVSRKGSMSGGFTGSSGSQARAFWSAKLQHDAAAARRSACEQQLAAAQQQQQAAEAQRFAAEQRLAAAKQQQALQSELRDATEAWPQEQQQLAELQTRHAVWQQRLEQCQAASGGSATKAAAAALCDELQAAAKAAAAAATDTAQELEAAQDTAEELAAAVEALDCRLAAMQAPEQQQEQELHACRQQLRELRQQQEAEVAAAAQRQERLRELEGEQQRLGRQVKAAQQQCASIHERAAEAAAAGRAAAAAVKAAAKELSRLQRDFADAEAVQESGRRPAAAATVDDGAAGSASTAAAVAVSEAQLVRLSRAVRQLKARLDTLDVPDLLPGQKEARASRLAQAARFRQQAEALRGAAAALEQHVSSGAEQVAAANDAVYEDVAAGVSALCASLLPSLELQLVRTASLAHEGLHIRFRRRPDGSAAEESELGAMPDDALSEWQHNLGQLSGGQRTLVSLAMLLAVARAGGSSTGLLLLDEVDAALDEHNTARTAALLRQLAHGGCQVLCVTHNAAFTACCDALIRVSKPAGGHTVPAGGETEEGVDASDNPQQQQQQQRGRGPQQGGSVAAAAGGGGAGGRQGSRAKRVRFAAA